MLERFVDYCKNHKYERTSRVDESHRQLEAYFMSNLALFGFSGLVYVQGETYFVRDGERLRVDVWDAKNKDLRIITPDAILVDNIPHVVEFASGNKKGKRKRLIAKARAISDSFGFEAVGVHLIRKKNVGVHHAQSVVYKNRFLQTNDGWEEILRQEDN